MASTNGSCVIFSYPRIAFLIKYLHSPRVPSPTHSYNTFFSRSINPTITQVASRHHPTADLALILYFTLLRSLNKHSISIKYHSLFLCEMYFCISLCAFYHGIANIISFHAFNVSLTWRTVPLGNDNDNGSFYNTKLYIIIRRHVF